MCRSRCAPFAGTLAFRPARRTCHQPCAAFEHARRGGVPQVMKPARHTSVSLGAFPRLLHALDRLCGGRRIGIHVADVVIAIPDVCTRTTLDQRPGRVKAARGDRLMQRRGMRVRAERVETIRILAGVDQHPDRGRLVVDRGHHQRAPTITRRCVRQQAHRLLDAASTWPNTSAVSIGDVHNPSPLGFTHAPRTIKGCTSGSSTPAVLGCAVDTSSGSAVQRPP